MRAYMLISCQDWDDNQKAAADRASEWKRATTKPTTPAAAATRSTASSSESGPPQAKRSKTRLKVNLGVSQAELQKLMPEKAAAYIVVDDINQRVRSYYPNDLNARASHSCSVLKYGRTKAVAEALKWAWAEHTSSVGDECPYDFS